MSFNKTFIYSINYILNMSSMLVNGRIFQTLNPKKFSVSTIKETAQRIAKLKKVQVAHAGTNSNFYTFTEEELMNAAKTLKDKPIYINYLGVAPDDHADNSSMNTIGWSTDAWYDPEDKTLYANADITTPDVIDKLERVDSKGRRELNFVSMSCDSMPICSVCGAIFNECEHERGVEYEGKMCSVVGKDVNFRNFVLTNEPADPNAVVGEVSIENSSLKKRCLDMKKNEKAQEVEQKPPELEEKKVASSEDILAGIQKQLLELEQRLMALEGKGETAGETTPPEMTDEEKKKLEEKKKAEETSAAGNAPIANPTPNDTALPTDSSPPSSPPSPTIDNKEGKDKLPDGSKIENKPATLESVTEIDKLKNEHSTLKTEYEKIKTENAKFRASQIRDEMKEFARLKKDLITLGFSEVAEKATTLKELQAANEVAKKVSGSSPRRERFSGSDIPKFVDSRGTQLSEEASNTKPKIDVEKKGAIISAIREAASKK